MRVGPKARSSRVWVAGVLLIVCLVCLVSWTASGIAVSRKSQLARAAQLSDIATVRRLLEAGTDPNSRAYYTGRPWLDLMPWMRARKDAEGLTALMWGARNGDRQMVKELLKAGAAADLQPAPEGSALCIAARMSRTGIAIDLLSAGANPNTDFQGFYVVHYAAGLGDVQLMKELIRRGVNLNVKTRAGETALQLAEGREMLQLLRQQ